MDKRTLDLRKVFGMITTYNNDQLLVSPNKLFDVVSELYPGGEPAIHVHPDQDEVYEVKEGEIQLYLNGNWRRLKVGETITIPKGTKHAFKNAGKEKVVAFNRHDPGLRFGEMLETIQLYINEGKITGLNGFKNLAYISSIMIEYNDVMVPVKPPFAMVKAISRIGKLLGCK